MASSEEIRKMTDFLQQMKGGKLQQKQAEFDKTSYNDYLGAYGKSQVDWKGRQDAYTAAQAKYQTDYGNYLSESNRRLDTYEGQNQGLINAYKNQLTSDTAAYDTLISDWNAADQTYQQNLALHNMGNVPWSTAADTLIEKFQGPNGDAWRVLQDVGPYRKGQVLNYFQRGGFQSYWYDNIQGSPYPGERVQHPGAFTAPTPPNIPDFQGLPDPIQFTGTDPGAAPTFNYQSPVSPYSASISKLANQTKQNARSTFKPATPSWDVWKNAYGMYGQR